MMEDCELAVSGYITCSLLPDDQMIKQLLGFGNFIALLRLSVSELGRINDYESFGNFILFLC